MATLFKLTVCAAACSAFAAAGLTDLEQVNSLAVLYHVHMFVAIKGPISGVWVFQD